MNNHDFKNKKIGIWGFGVAGKSVYDFITQQPCSIQILDKKSQANPCWIEQTETSIIDFLEHNDIIVASPGIPLHKFQTYQHKYITELDIFSQHYSGTTIAITGTLGKTSITHAIQHCSAKSIAAGNIGYPMLAAASQSPLPEKIILELSSFQLQYNKTFGPDIALWTNFYPNHLDHHINEEEYFASKCNIFKYQKQNQYAIIPCNLIQRIQKTILIKSQIFLTCTQSCNHHDLPTFSLQDNNIILTKHATNNSSPHKTTDHDTSSDKTSRNQIIFNNINQLPVYTYIENWLQIIAALHLQNVSTTHIIAALNSIPAQEDRLEKIATYNNTTFYNDSKSTVWQATQQAIEALANESCTLFLGGISKGTDRSPLVAYLQKKPVTVFAFGKEAKLLQELCKNHNVTCFAFNELEEALAACMSKPLPKNILFSPAGASFDLFKNYHHRGTVFKDLVANTIKNMK